MQRQEWEVMKITELPNNRGNRQALSWLAFVCLARPQRTLPLHDAPPCLGIDEIARYWVQGSCV